jgi:2-C-methyl-D-erythritol 4-phosphate cytidylyltransferase
MGTDVPKQFLLLRGRPVLMHTLEAFHNYDPCMQIILVLASDQKDYWVNLCLEHDFMVPHVLVDGGATRFHSVKNALNEIVGNALVAVHDGVRPIVDPELLDTLFLVAENKKGAYPAVPVVDSIRRVTSYKSTRVMDRTTFRLVQTPQVFWARILMLAYRSEYSDRFTDDASLVESRRLCKPIMIDGRRDNIKITTPIDLMVAEAILSKK